MTTCSKKSIALLIALVLVLAMTACAPQEEAVDDPVDPVEEVTHKTELVAAIGEEIQNTDHQQVTSIFGLVNELIRPRP